MKFENPIMNISMFEVENVVTSASGEPPVTKTDAENALAAANSIESVEKVITVTF